MSSTLIVGLNKILQINQLEARRFFLLVNVIKKAMHYEFVVQDSENKLVGNEVAFYFIFRFCDVLFQFVTFVTFYLEA